MKTRSKTLIHQAGATLFLWLFIAFASMAQEGGLSRSSTKSGPNHINLIEGPVKIENEGNYYIEGKGVPTENTITVELGSMDEVATITLDDVNIELGDCPFNIIRGTVRLILEGDNGNFLVALPGNAGLQVSAESKLIIEEASNGKLTARGGGESAGIGGSSATPAGSITIAGGTVVAEGGGGGAGIGGGYGRSVGSITIKGGTVEATGGSDGAGIGGGWGNKAVSITIEGGTVKATGGENGAGIGGGYVGDYGGSVGSITISGGIVEATGGADGAGIGGGYKSNGGTIAISGGKVTTEGNIGDGEAGSGAKGTISGGTIACKSITSTLTISGGSVRTDDNSVIKGMAVVKVPHANAKVALIKIGEDSSYGSKDVYTDGEGKLYLYIPQDKSGPVTLTIEGIANPLPAIREYDITNGSVAITTAGDYAIVGGGTLTGNAITVELKSKEDVANITIDGVDIQTEGCPFDIIQGTVNLTLAGKDNILQAGTSCAALQVSEDSKLVITEKSTGKLTARGGSGAGIGGGYKGSAGSITIAGGKITTTGNIGDGVDGSGATGEISGGTIVCKSISPTLSITGGSVYTEDNSVMSDGKGMAVVKGLPKETEVTLITIDEAPYGSNDVYTDDKGQLYLYIPKGDPVFVSLTIDNQVYTIYVTLADLITIDTNESYNPTTHKDKNITITSKGTFTINVAEASVIDLTIEKGGKLLTVQPLEVKGGFTVEPNAVDDKWITFCSPVPLNLLYQSWATGAGSSDCLFLKSGFTTATDQKWTLVQSIEKDTPYLIGVPSGGGGYALYAQHVTLPGRKEDISIDPPSGFDNNLLFCTNTSLTEQTLMNIYVLEDNYNGKQAIVLKDNYTLQPFEAYFVASPASPTPPAIESQGEPGKMTLPEQGAAPNDVIMPQKLTLKQPHSGKGNFTVKKEGQVAYGFALEGATVTLELSPNATDGYSIDNSLIKVYKTDKPNETIELSMNNAPYSFTMPNDPVTIEVEFKKTLNIIPDKDQVLYEDEEYTAYKPTYTVEGITEADGDVVFTGNLKLEGDEPYQIVNNDLSAGYKYELKVEPGVTVTQLSGNASDAVAIPDKNTAGQDGWYLGPNNSFTLKAPTGFLIKQATPTTRSLSNATAADEYTDKLVFTDEGEHIIHYNLKRIGMDTPPSENKSITYKLDYSLPQYNVTVNERSATVKLADWISGLAECSYKWDGGPKREISGFKTGDKEATFTLSGNAGSHTLSLKLIDVAGNVLEETSIPVTLEDTYVPPYVPDDDNDNDSDDPDPNPDPDPVANETILGSSFGIGIDNGKLSLEASQPCRLFIHTFSGSLQYMKQLPAGTTRLYNLPASRYIITLETPKGVIRRKVMVW